MQLLRWALLVAALAAAGCSDDDYGLDLGNNDAAVTVDSASPSQD
jgi:hypothetical protein